MNNEIQNTNNYPQEGEKGLIPADVIESLVLNGDLSKMTGDQKVQFYNNICKSMGLNPLTQPFEIISLKGKLKMYAKKDATDQLRRIYGVSVTKIETAEVAGIYMATAYVKDKFGREDSDVGAVTISNLQGENLANAIMKATTKAKRRATLSICGLGMLDESEVESIKAQEQSEAPEGYLNIDTVNPNDPSEVQRFENMLAALPNPIIPDEMFPPGQTREQFANNFRSEMMSGTLSREYANSVYQKMEACFLKKN